MRPTHGHLGERVGGKAPLSSLGGGWGAEEAAGQLSAELGGARRVCTGQPGVKQVPDQRVQAAAAGRIPAALSETGS